MERKKGQLGGVCARAACGFEPATFFNSSTRQHYCGSCAEKINRHAGQALCVESLDGLAAVDPTWDAPIEGGPTNRSRAERSLKAVREFTDAKGDPGLEPYYIGDLITDALHLAAALDFDTAEVLRMAVNNFEHEQAQMKEGEDAVSGNA